MPTQPTLSPTALQVAEAFDAFASLQGTENMHLEFNADGSGAVTAIVNFQRVILRQWPIPEDAIASLCSFERGGMMETAHSQGKIPPAGIVLIITESVMLARVIVQLRTIPGMDDIDPAYYAGLCSARGGIQIKQGMIYLELPHGVWANVVHWCRQAQYVGLIETYHAAEVGPMQKSEEVS